MHGIWEAPDGSGTVTICVTNAGTGGTRLRPGPSYVLEWRRAGAWYPGGKQDRMQEHVPFGVWLRDRRRAQDATRAGLARRIGCSVETVRKLESGERRPSKQLAELL